LDKNSLLLGRVGVGMGLRGTQLLILLRLVLLARLDLLVRLVQLDQLDCKD
jgi:hypothetical protein